MAAQRGRDMLLRVHDGNQFNTLAGLRAKRLSFNAASVDVTDSESIGRWRELLADGGVRRASVSGSGIFKDAASDSLLRDIFFGTVIERFQLVIPGFGTLEGAFQITALDYSGNHDGEITFEAAMESAGPVTFGGSA